MQLKIRHRGRIAQIGIYFSKFLRMFVFQSDWKVLPMSALIAGLVGIVMSLDFRKTMEGTLMAAFAMACVCIWNGCFNSIQVICRERDVIKWEHRSGMHITSYISAHMMYQMIICLLETVVTLIISGLVGMNYSGAGVVTPWLILDFGITMFLVTYAADMMSLWISSISHSTTTAMTIMPFLLIFELIFSGGIIPLPRYATPITMLTISNPGLKAMAAQADMNSLPYGMVSSIINMVDDMEIGGTITLGQVLDVLGDDENESIAKLRGTSIGNVMSVEELLGDLETSDLFEGLRSEKLILDISAGDAISALRKIDWPEEIKEYKIGMVTTLGEVIDLARTNDTVQKYRDESVVITTTVGDVLDMAGRDDTQKLLEEKAAQANYDPLYASTPSNVTGNWIHLLIFIAVFSVLTIITMEFIDKDKR